MNALNRELFGNLHEARVILESWRLEYTEGRPHKRPTGRCHFPQAVLHTHLHRPSSCRRAHHFFALTSLRM
jgi:hypothetical protein